MVGSMREYGKMILGMVKDLSVMQTEIHILVTLAREKLMAKVFTLGKMARYSMESGIKDLSTDTVYGKEFMETHLLVNGIVQKLMAMVSTHGPIMTGMRVNGTWV
jgi:hypothetical protein